MATRELESHPYLSDSKSATDVLWAIDLTEDPRYRQLWLQLAAMPAEQAAALGLPAGGTASPMGYWFYPADGAGAAPPGILVVRVYICPGEEVHADPHLVAAPLKRFVVTRSWRAPKGEGNQLTLLMGMAEAHVFATRMAWDAMSEAILLALGQYWRFHRVELELQRLGALARDARRHAVMPTLKTWQRQRQSADCDREIRDLVDDWAHFEGALCDPARYCSSQPVVEDYTRLAEQLGLQGWAERLDDRIEIVEAHWEMATERFLHYKLFIWGLAVEFVIIVLLIAMYFRWR
jgi:hypothetical protein